MRRIQGFSLVEVVIVVAVVGLVGVLGYVAWDKFGTEPATKTSDQQTAEKIETEEDLNEAEELLDATEVVDSEAGQAEAAAKL